MLLLLVTAIRYVGGGGSEYRGRLQARDTGESRHVAKKKVESSVDYAPLQKTLRKRKEVPKEGGKSKAEKWEDGGG